MWVPVGLRPVKLLGAALVLAFSMAAHADAPKALAASPRKQPPPAHRHVSAKDVPSLDKTVDLGRPRFALKYK